jgi:hypothetical protein
MLLLDQSILEAYTCRHKSLRITITPLNDLYWSMINAKMNLSYVWNAQSDPRLED